MRKRIGIAMIALLFLLLTCVEAAADAEPEFLGAVSETLSRKPSEDLSEWELFALLRSGKTPDPAALRGCWLREQLALRENRPQKPTDLARAVLVLTAAGGKEAVEESGIPALLNDAEKAGAQGINGLIWTLIALDSGPYLTGSEGETLRGTLVTALGDRAAATGGWELTAGRVDPDLTAMALVALEPYRSDPGVEELCRKAFGALSEMQLPTGGFSSFGSESPESAAQVLIALSTWNIPTDDPRFVKNGKTVRDALTRYYADGAFSKNEGGQANAISTVQGFLALIAENRKETGKSGLFRAGDFPASPLFDTAFTQAELDALIREAEDPAPAGADRWSSVLRAAIFVTGGILVLILILSLCLRARKRKARNDPEAWSIDPPEGGDEP